MRELDFFISQARKEISELEGNTKRPKVLDVFEKVVGLIEKRGLIKSWTKDLCLELYQAMGAADDEGKPLLPEKELFRINVALSYVLKLLRDRGNVRIRHWPYVLEIPALFTIFVGRRNARRAFRRVSNHRCPCEA